MSDQWVFTRTVYDTVAENYAELMHSTGSEAVLDLAMLEDFAGRVRGAARVLDAGCGPGRLTRYLSDRRVDAFGIDLAPAMVRVARRLHPDLDFEVGSIDALDIGSDALSGVLASYSMSHTPPVRSRNSAEVIHTRLTRGPERPEKHLQSFVMARKL